jgi:hypothetical protein
MSVITSEAMKKRGAVSRRRALATGLAAALFFP